MMNKLKIILVDDQPILLEGLKSLITTCEDMEVIACAHDGQEAIELARKYQPDVILMDIRMPKMNGVEATKMIKSEFSQITVIILTTFEDDEYIIDALRYGASGYLLKDMGIHQLAQSIRDGVKGNLLLPTRIASKLTAHMIHSPSRVSSFKEEYTPREKEMIQLLVQGCTNQEIADRLFLSIGTVKNYLSQIYAKAQVTDRANAIIYFKHNGF